MTQQAMEESLRVALGEVKGIDTPALLTDFRKLKAIFACTAEAYQEHLCSMYKPHALGCTFKNELTKECGAGVVI